MPIRNDGAGQRDERLALFVEKATYRRRRLMDIARLAPIMGALLFAVPLLWPADTSEPGEAVRTSAAMIYVFCVWTVLVGFGAAFSLAVRLWAVHWTHRSDAEALVGPVGQTSPLMGAEQRPKQTPEQTTSGGPLE